MLRRLKRWWMRRWTPRPDVRDEDAPELKRAVQQHLSSIRLVRMHADKSATALRQLNEALALRTRALHGIEAAESALDEIERKAGDK
jgi:hypothetical protein